MRKGICYDYDSDRYFGGRFSEVMRIKWYPIDDHPNYELNRLGQVRNKRTGKILKPFDDRRGYLRVTLDGVNVKLHILVAEKFVVNPDPVHKTIVNHKKGNKHDPRYRLPRIPSTPGKRGL